MKNQSVGFTTGWIQQEQKTEIIQTEKKKREKKPKCTRSVGQYEAI